MSCWVSSLRANRASSGEVVSEEIEEEDEVDLEDAFAGVRLVSIVSTFVKIVRAIVGCFCSITISEIIKANY